MQRKTKPKHSLGAISKALIIFLGAVLLAHSAAAQVTKEAAYDILVNQMMNGSVDGKRVYALSAAVASNSAVNTWKGPINLPNVAGWLFFIDDHPWANWEHACRYVIVDEVTGAITEIPARVPPDNIAEMEELATVEAPPAEPIKKLTFPQKNGHWYAVNKKAYAVIISGGANAYNNWVRYWNDVSYIYQTLKEYYGLLDGRIKVLMSDGKDPGDDRHHYDGGYDSSPLDLDFDGDNDVNYSATKANINTVFNWLANKMDRDSFLFIFTTDHGGLESGNDVYLNLWGETIRDDEFAAQVNKITDHAGMIIVMEQCHSGGMLDDLAAGVGVLDPPRIMASACRADESSWAMAPDYLYNEFVYYWTAAANWAYPDGTYVDADLDNDYMTQADEAFDFAELKDTASETPQYIDTSSFGDDLSLYFMTRRCIYNSPLDKFVFTVKGTDGHSYGAYVKDDGIAGDVWKLITTRVVPLPKEKVIKYNDGTLDNWSPAAAFSYSGGVLKARNVIKYKSGLDLWPARMNVRFKHYSSSHATDPTLLKQTKP